MYLFYYILKIWDFMLICIFAAIVYFIYKNRKHFLKNKDPLKE